MHKLWFLITLVATCGSLCAMKGPADVGLPKEEIVEVIIEGQTHKLGISQLDFESGMKNFKFPLKIKGLNFFQFSVILGRDRVIRLRPDGAYAQVVNEDRQVNTSASMGRGLHSESAQVQTGVQRGESSWQTLGMIISISLFMAYLSFGPYLLGYRTI